MYSVDFEIKDFIEQSVKGWLLLKLGWRPAIGDIADSFAETGAKLTADLLERETHGTGRAAASIGKYDPTRLRHPDSSSSEADAFWEAHDEGEDHVREYGSRVPYMAAINLGYTIEKPRVIKVGEHYVTVHPQSFVGKYVFERALVELEANEVLQMQLVMQHLSKIGFTIG